MIHGQTGQLYNNYDIRNQENVINRIIFPSINLKNLNNFVQCCRGLRLATGIFQDANQNRADATYPNFAILFAEGLLVSLHGIRLDIVFDVEQPTNRIYDLRWPLQLRWGSQLLSRSRTSSGITAQRGIRLRCRVGQGHQPCWTRHNHRWSDWWQS